MKKGYQLLIRARYLACSGNQLIYSKEVFLDKSKITDEIIENFTKACINKGTFWELDESSIKFSIVDVNIIE